MGSCGPIYDWGRTQRVKGHEVRKWRYSGIESLPNKYMVLWGLEDSQELGNQKSEDFSFAKARQTQSRSGEKQPSVSLQNKIVQVNEN